MSDRRCPKCGCNKCKNINRVKWWLELGGRIIVGLTLQTKGHPKAANFILGEPATKDRYKCQRCGHEWE
jgi:hypothetical protein